jgi:hypothetical protein
MPSEKESVREFESRFREGQLTEAENRLIGLSYKHLTRAKEAESTVQTLRSQLSKVGEHLADAAISDGELELEAKDDFVRRFEADPVAVATELYAEAPMVVDQRFFGEKLPSRGDQEKADTAGRLGLDPREVI